MSIILKGIDLPKEGEMHLIISKNGIICSAEYPAKVNHAYPLNLNAQAIQIPKGHGDLIDRNQVFTYSHRDVQNLEEVPVILEGEEK